MAHRGGRGHGRGRWELAGPSLIPQPPQLFPEAVKEYPDISCPRYNPLKNQVRRHLAYLGWTIYFNPDTGGYKYDSPDGTKIYHSLRGLCLDLIQDTQEAKEDEEEEEEGEDVCLGMEKGDVCSDMEKGDEGRMLAPQENLNLSATGSNDKRSDQDTVRPSGYCPEAVEYWSEYATNRKENMTKKSHSDMKSKARSHLFSNGWTSLTITKKSGRKAPCYISPTGKKCGSLRRACGVCIHEGLSAIRASPNQIPVFRPKRKRRRYCSSSSSSDDELQCEKSSSSAVTVQIHVPRPSNSRSKPKTTLLLWLIKNGVVNEGTAISYYSFSGAEIFTPYANLFLDDGRSVLECQRQALLAIKAKNSQRETNVDVCSLDDNDNICSICRYGGTLLLCDQCPSAFHHTCIGLSSIPEGEWVCPSCKCKICDRFEYEGTKNWENHDLVLHCKLCACKFHVGCIDEERRVSRMEGSSRYVWFCEESCEKVFTTLDELSGRTYFMGGPDNLTWTLLKPMEGDHLDDDDPMMPAYVVNQSKLHVAVGLLHECFMPILEKFTGEDMIESVVFNHTSDLKRLNFQGFYTITIERDEKLLTVATIRVHDKVAELPFIGTSSMYRRQGVGRIMMSKIEELLRRLGGIERLILPAAPTLLEMWTRKFGFSVMTTTERQQYAHYNFLDFQKTALCYKLLG